MLEELKLCPVTNEICSSKCSQKDISSCGSALELQNDSFSLKLSNNVEWIKVQTVSEIFDIFEKLDKTTSYMLISGSTSHGNLFCILYYIIFIYFFSVSKTIPKKVKIFTVI